MGEKYSQNTMRRQMTCYSTTPSVELVPKSKDDQLSGNRLSLDRKKREPVDVCMIALLIAFSTPHPNDLSFGEVYHGIASNFQP